MEIINEDKNRNNHNCGGLLFGLLLIAVGTILVLTNMDVLSFGWRRVLLSWQMLLIVIGIFQLSKRNIIPGTVLSLVGLFFIVPRLAPLLSNGNVFVDNFSMNYWPILLIAVGVIIIISMTTNHNNESRWHEKFESRCNREGRRSFSQNGSVHYNYVFSGTEEVFMEPEFKGGDIQVLFGGVTLDLRRTNLPEGITRLKIDALFGGVTILVPENWNIEIERKVLFGGFSDNRIKYNGYLNVADSENNSKLVIVAECLFGGGEVK
ncbi:MAG: LiaF domain-containing protein [Bacteroidales bacterium]|jgi:predicted membrane protein